MTLKHLRIMQPRADSDLSNIGRCPGRKNLKGAYFSELLFMFFPEVIKNEQKYF